MAPDFPLPAGPPLETIVRVVDSANPDQVALITVVLSADGTDPGAPSVPVTMAIRRAETGSIVLTLVGPLGQSQTLQTSPDLVHWTDGATAHTQSDGVPVDIEVPWPENAGEYFFRARRSP